MFFKLSIRNIHVSQKKPNDIHNVIAMKSLLAPVTLCKKQNILTFNPLKYKCRTGLAANVLAMQQHNRCHFVSFMMYISGAKFEEHYSMFPDILYSVFYHFNCTPHDIITFLICIIQKHQYSISKTRKDIPKRKTPFFSILKTFKYTAIIFHVICT